ncbi:16S rRNA pseudouridine(516) synthase [Mitsuaria sp. GD03876]|uniref:pseudouridine synthase n=1 Tax=Mitsuaria sp. GD03876 TaxID=2975399 RepID=UPI00244697EC|nr:16S rRNA pseudouridine(516) synthase [Mitsuaria sp. GD03876]MDH0868261.1 16S rRNA pseudouridine(516) synthase [Mitsuaria sp. GD03876]
MSSLPSKPEKPQPIAQILFTQGFGTRRHCAALVDHGLVTVAGEVVEDPRQAFDTAGLVFEVEGQSWPYHEKALILLHKPAGYECSRKPSHHPSVFSLLPEPVRNRDIQPVGRLDEDTTGLLLLTDDGPLQHKLTSPKYHVPKLYQAVCKAEVDEAQLRKLVEGVLLEERNPKLAAEPVNAVRAERLADGRLQMALTEGRYHQAKRMVAAVGNRVLALHRQRIGALDLPADLKEGGWMWLDDAQRELAMSDPAA